MEFGKYLVLITEPEKGLRSDTGALSLPLYIVSCFVSHMQHQ